MEIDTLAVSDVLITTEAVLTVAGLVLTLGTAILTVLLRKVWGPCRRWVCDINAAVKELQPNGGRSVLDRVRRLDNTIEELNARQRAVLDRDPVPVYECDPEGRCTYANIALCELFGLSEKDMLGFGWLESLHPDERIRVHGLWTECVRKRIPYECRYDVRDPGTHAVVPARTVAHPMLSKTGDLLGYHGTVRPLVGDIGR